MRIIIEVLVILGLSQSVRYEIKKYITEPIYIPLLCNGSTEDFDSSSIGSSPVSGARSNSERCRDKLPETTLYVDNKRVRNRKRRYVKSWSTLVAITLKKFIVYNIS